MANCVVLILTGDFTLPWSIIPPSPPYNDHTEQHKGVVDDGVGVLVGVSVFVGVFVGEGSGD